MAESTLYEQIRIALLDDVPIQGSEDYKPIDELFFVIDHPNWPKPRRIPADEVGAGGDGTSNVFVLNESIESSPTKTVTYTFPTAFNSIPVDIGFRVYKMLEFETGKYIQQDVLHYFPANWKSTSSFTVIIDDSEDLTGVFIKGIFAPVS